MGRPRKDRSEELAKEYDGLEIIGLDFPDASGHCRVRFRCLRCGTASSARLDDVKNGHTKSCRCLKIDLYKQFQEAQVDNLSHATVAECWDDHQNGVSRFEIAEKHEIPVPVVDFAIRRMQRRLDEIASEAQEDIWEQSQRPGGISAAAKQYGISHRAVLYICGLLGQPEKLQVDQPRLTELTDDAEIEFESDKYPSIDLCAKTVQRALQEAQSLGLETEADQVIQGLGKRIEYYVYQEWTRNGNEHLRPRFGRDELVQHRDGSFGGKFGKLYRTIERMLRRPDLPMGDLRSVFAWFAFTADATFEARRGRRDEWIRERRTNAVK